MVIVKPANFLHICLIAFFLSTYIFLLNFYLQNSSSPTILKTEKAELIVPSVSKSTEKVTRVVDGDTFEIQGGIKVRLIGMDTPEMKNKNKTIECFAVEAKNKLETMILGKEITLVKDISETDKYGRLLRYVYLGDEMVNDTLVKEGFAHIATFPPDVMYKDRFLSSERYARDSKAGLWDACK